MLVSVSIGLFTRRASGTVAVKIALMALGVVTGFLTGLLGIGGGVILLPALIYLPLPLPAMF